MKPIFSNFPPKSIFYTFFLPHGITKNGVQSIFGVKICVRGVKFSKNLKISTPQTQFFTPITQRRVRKKCKKYFSGKNLKKIILSQNCILILSFFGHPYLYGTLQYVWRNSWIISHRNWYKCKALFKYGKLSFKSFIFDAIKYKSYATLLYGKSYYIVWFMTYRINLLQI